MIRSPTLYINFEGQEGAGKTSQTSLLVEYLKSKKKSVLNTKEPGTPLIPMTMRLRRLMLEQGFTDNMKATRTEITEILLNEPELTQNATEFLEEIQKTTDEKMNLRTRELLSQAIRSIHLEHLIYPEIYDDGECFDYIVQDRGILSGLVYGNCCGNSMEELEKLAMKVCKTKSMDEIYKLYDKVILLVCDPEEGLKRARSSKQEFKTGDAIENKGVEFQKQVYDKMFEIGKKFNPIIIDTSNKNKEQVFEEIKKALNL